MDDQLLMTFFGVALGAIGYWVATFWIQPILRWRTIRQQILSDLIFYADAVIADGMSDRIQERRWQRINSNRRSSADLYSCLETLPFWHRIWLKSKKIDIEKAARNLIGYANTPDYDDAVKRVNVIKAALGLKTDVI